MTRNNYNGIIAIELNLSREGFELYAGFTWDDKRTLVETVKDSRRSFFA